jgi:hypothetical protein
MSASARATAVFELRAALLSARAKLALASLALPASVAGAISGRLADDGAKVDRLAPGGDLGTGAGNGTFAESRWFAIALTTREDIAAQLDTLGGALPSWGRAWDEVIAPTGETIGAGAAAAASLAMPAIAVVALVALAYLVFVARKVGA